MELTNDYGNQECGSETDKHPFERTVRVDGSDRWIRYRVSYAFQTLRKTFPKLRCVCVWFVVNRTANESINPLDADSIVNDDLLC